MKDSLMKLRPVMLSMGEIQKRKGFEMPVQYDALIALISDDESVKELVDAKFSTYEEEEEDTFSEKASSEDSEVLALFLQVVPGSAAVLNIFYKEIEKDLVFALIIEFKFFN